MGAAVEGGPAAVEGVESAAFPLMMLLPLMAVARAVSDLATASIWEKSL